MQIYKKIVFLTTLILFSFVGIVFAQLDETVLLDRIYSNRLCYLCYETSQDTVDVEHEMYDVITIDTDNIHHVVDPDWGDILEVDSGALEYSVYTDFLPPAVLKNNDSELVDSSYRGESIFLYDEYFVKEWDADEGLLKLAKGSFEIIDNTAFGSDFEAGDGVYQFKIHQAIESENQTVGAVIDVRNPKGMEVQVVAQRSLNAVVGDVEIYAVHVAAAGDFVQAEVIVYDLSTEIILEEGEKLDDFTIDFDKVDLGCLADLGDGALGDCGGGASWNSTESADVQYRFQDYNKAAPAYGDKGMLKRIKLIYRRDKTLGPGESISFPLNMFRFTYEGNETYNLEILKLDGESCSDNLECQSNYCVHEVCRASDPYCGDDYCDHPEETYLSCPSDCKPDGESCSHNLECHSNHCVHEVCRPTEPYCGDDYCDSGENYSSCPEDCEEPPECIKDEDCADTDYCSNEECVEVTGTCGYVENHEWINHKCCEDAECDEGHWCVNHECKEKPVICGDETCEGDENCESCEIDCGACPKLIIECPAEAGSSETITCRVTDEDGNVIAGATVILTTPDGTSETFRTHEDGTIRATMDQSGRIDAIATEEGYDQSETESIIVSEEPSCLGLFLLPLTLILILLLKKSGKVRL